MILDDAVEAGLKKLECARVGAAVSGGPDSMALLGALIHARDKLRIPIFVITINHNIRPPEESRADAFFVHDYCKKNDIECSVIEFEPGKISRIAEARNRGVEEAARFLRYQAFAQFVHKKKLDTLCLGHTYSDHIETLLQRFLQGAQAEGLRGIQKKRDYYFRPLLDFTREQINAFIKENNIPFVTDSTNSTDAYLRNRIRHQLVPVLDEHFAGWRTAVRAGAEKNSCDADFFNSLTKEIHWTKTAPEEREMSTEVFFGVHKALQLRLLQKALYETGAASRLPYAVFKAVLDGQKKISAAGFEISVLEQLIRVKRATPRRKRRAFFAIIANQGTVLFPEFCADIFNEAQEKNKNGFTAGPFELPFVIRTFAAADEVLTAQGGSKKISKLFADWKIPVEFRAAVPVIEKNGEIVCVCASFLGYKDWYVRKEPQTGTHVYIQFERIQ